MTRAAIYYTSYSRALTKYVSSGFFARDLDADDFAFIEHVRERRTVCCGSLAQLTPTACTYSDDVFSRVALIEEMDFWRRPYPVDQIAVRRHGPLPRSPRQASGCTPAALKRKQDRELAIAARAAEYAEAQSRAKERQLEQLRRDVEWEKSEPKPRVFGRVKGRHYIPQWRVDELDLVVEREERAAAAAVRENIKSGIVAVLKAIFPIAITFDELTLRLGCGDKALVMSCADELITSGLLREHAPVAPVEPPVAKSQGIEGWRLL